MTIRVFKFSVKHELGFKFIIERMHYTEYLILRGNIDEKRIYDLPFDYYYCRLQLVPGNGI